MEARKKSKKSKQSVELQKWSETKAKVYKLQRSKETLEEKCRTLELSMAQLKPVVDAKKAKYEKFKDEYEALNPNETEVEDGLEKDCKCKKGKVGRVFFVVGLVIVLCAVSFAVGMERVYLLRFYGRRCDRSKRSKENERSFF